MIIREYLKLARSFNAVLTGISPVMGAIAMKQYDLFHLFILFLIGFLGHTYGFVLNDIIDYKIDKHSKEIIDRPLISGSISIRKAWIFAMVSMLLAFIITIGATLTIPTFFGSSLILSIIILIISALFITLYDITSKKFPLTDIFVAIGIFFLILYGASTSVETIDQITVLAWIVCLLGAIQAFFMNIVAGGLKDIENDFKKGAKTIAVKMGVRVINKQLKVYLIYKIIAYAIQLLDILIVFLPFFIIQEFEAPSILRYIQWILLGTISILMLFFSHKLLTLKYFDRNRARKYIGIHYYTNFALVPIMLMTLNPWTFILTFFPLLGFVLSNVILHGTILQPKTM